MLYLVFILYALFASLFSLSKATLEVCEPIFFIGSRMTFAGIILVGFELLRNTKAVLSINRHIFWQICLLGLINIYLTNIAEIWGIMHMISAKACLLYSLSPFVSAILSYFVFSEVLSKRKWLALGVGFLGMTPCFVNGWLCSYDNCMSLFSNGELVLFVAVFCSCLGWILLRGIVTKSETSFVLANGISMMIGGALALLHSYASGETWQPVPVYNWEIFLRNSLIFCVISNFICYNLYGFLLKKFTATFMAFSGLITPVFASVFGWFFLKETVSWDFFLSFILFASGLFIFHSEEITENYRVKNKTPIRGSI